MISMIAPSGFARISDARRDCYSSVDERLVSIIEPIDYQYGMKVMQHQAVRPDLHVTRGKTFAQQAFVDLIVINVEAHSLAMTAALCRS